jgi:PhzF family phenazine biosynthesis protein
MTYQLFQIDAFTSKLFGGNPAAVVPLQSWLPDQTMQQLALENNLSETAFFIPLDQPDSYHIRWFTPAAEVRLCGHATLATAFAIFNCLKSNKSNRIAFQSQSGWLHVQQDGDWLTLDFPTDRIRPSELPLVARHAFQPQPKEVWLGQEDFLLVYDSESEVLALEPDLVALLQVPSRGFIATAPGLESDFVSRCFFPAFGINEDPVTGSAHTTLMPYWAAKLKKNTLQAIQRSEREGFLKCTLQGERVLISGQAKLYLEGTFFLD